jgi:hypothetical protein
MPMNVNECNCLQVNEIRMNKFNKKLNNRSKTSVIFIMVIRTTYAGSRHMHLIQFVSSCHTERDVLGLSKGRLSLLPTLAEHMPKTPAKKQQPYFKRSIQILSVLSLGGDSRCSNSKRALRESYIAKHCMGQIHFPNTIQKPCNQGCGGTDFTDCACAASWTLKVELMHGS